jgi:hypothetical protein
MPVEVPNGTHLLVPRLQLVCYVRLPNLLMPLDGIIDPGSPLSWFPEAVWSRLRPGIDFEELPFEAGYMPPRAQAAGWSFSFRVARMLQPVVLMDTSTELERNAVIVQFADGNPPIPPGSKKPPRVVIGLWGGILEGLNLRMATDPGTGHTVGALEW